MPTLIKDGRIEVDDWHFVEDAEVSPQTRIIVPARYANEHTASLFAQGREIGIWIDGDGEIHDVAAIAGRAALIAIRFPSFNDGRGLSLAVLLRTRLNYRGELRAIGDVHADMFHYLHRCGFDSFLLPDGRDPHTALATLSALSDFYQGSVVEPEPAFRRVARG